MPPSPTPQMLIRADADSRIGSGHLLRCLALAQAWQAHGGHATFLSHCASEGLRRRIQIAQVTLLDLESPHPDPDDLGQTLDVLRQLAIGYAPPWLVLDGYHFDPHYHNRIRNAGYRLLVVDDTAYLSHYSATLLLNQTVVAHNLPYEVDQDTTLLLGTRYALLRPEFAAFAGKRRSIADVALKMLVTMGGGDADNVSLRMVRALVAIKRWELELKVVLGPSYQHGAEMRAATRGKQGIELLAAVHDMAALMQWADMAISAGGSTCWELACLGLPSVLVGIATNQLAVIEELDRLGIAVSLGVSDHLIFEQVTEVVSELALDRHRRAAMSGAGQALIDGRGACRVVQAMHGGKATL